MPKTERPKWAKMVLMYCVNRDLRQSHLAKKVGVCSSVLSEHLAGKRKPKPKLLNKISKALDLDEIGRRDLHRKAAEQLGFDISYELPKN